MMRTGLSPRSLNESSSNLANRQPDGGLARQQDRTPNRRSWIGRLGGFITRQGPARVDEVGLPAKIRWCRDPAWRPKNLGVLKLSDCQTFAVPAAPPDFPASASGFPPEWSYAVPPPSRVTPSAA
jgi:hypothetical protein